jgi:hypothetical protein
MENGEWRMEKELRWWTVYSHSMVAGGFELIS